jgi:hypothetical protein
MKRSPAPIAMLVLVLAAAAPAAAHVERTSYWPDPAPDTAVSPPAGGAVPRARSLFGALDSKTTKVVCQRGSLRRGLRSVRAARRHGVRIRPTAPLQRISARRARRHARFLRGLARRCAFRHIQAAVNKSHNNGRVVIMPGHYIEGPSRSQPENDPRCADLREDTEIASGAASYRYQVACPNDQSLIYVQGRALSATPPPDPPLENRFGIPDEGPCVRCNLQIDGAGVRPGDVVIDAATDPSGPLRARTDPAKDVVIRADRADGFVIRNLTTVHAQETGLYIHETDGYLIDDFKALYNGLYGTLTFTSDHGLTTDCVLSGARDSGVYPGGAPDTGAQRIEAVPRLNQVVTRCDLHHNAAGYSGVMGNAVHLVGNEIYDNGSGIVIASVFPGGHPGYPQDSAMFEDNRVYSNNFDVFAADTDVRSVLPVPVGTGIVIIGGNDNFRENRVWDNWRWGAMQISLPDALAGDSAPGAVVASTSHGNRYYDNVMGAAPDGTRSPNGLDFWFDDAPAQRNNCWHDNGAVSTDPPSLPASCENTTLGVAYPQHLATELLPCLGGLSGDFDPAKCDWFAQPPPPGSAARAARRPARCGSGCDRGAAWEEHRPFANTDTLQFATCEHWLRLGERGRGQVVARMEQLIRGQAGLGAVLSRADGLATFGAACPNPAQRAMLLFEVYDHAVAFRPLGARR